LGVREIPLLGLPLADLNIAAAASWIAAREGGSFGYVVTPNADHFVRLHHQPHLRPLYTAASLRLFDSRLMAHAARALCLAAPTVCPGSDLAEELLRHHTRPGERITIIGLRPQLLPILTTRFGLAPPAHYDPPMGFWRDPSALHAAVDFARVHPARLTFLALGSPGQEILAQAIAATPGTRGTGLCLGAALDFLTGGARRAPGWMQATGLEWLHRLAREPRRLWRRYLLDDPLIFYLLLRARQRGEDFPAKPAQQ